MKIAVFVVVYLAFVSLAFARNTFLDDLFVESSSKAAMASGCNATDSCAGKGDTCKGNYLTGSGGCNKTAGTCCASGLYCINTTCVTDNVGDPCSNTQPCYSASSAKVSCVKGYCQYVYSVGDTCMNNTDCIYGMCNNTCQGVAAGGACSATASPSQCNFGLFCSAMANNTCQNTTAQGSTCSYPSQCTPGTTCFADGFGANANTTCQQIGTQSTGMPCMDSSACTSGDVCDLLATNKTCVAVNTSMVACTANSNCTNGLCLCSPVTGDQFCHGFLYNNPCTSEDVSLTSCLASSQCTSASDAPNSCCYANCLSDYKKTFSCRCSLASSIGSGCFYNQYCGGFPVWAIIVIIVVAIVLVLAIVLLVFFMMRRRRQYDSI